MLTGKLRLGLCCIFREEPVKFRQITAKTLLKLRDREEQIHRLSEICLHNAKSLKAALQYSARNGIGAFRILSPLFPRYTHRQVRYTLEELLDAESIIEEFAEIREFRKKHDLRLSFHPDQFNVLSSPRDDVIINTKRELEYQAMLADYVDAEIINIHAGGVYGNKHEALQRLIRNAKQLPENVLSRLTIENDDRSYTPADLLSICEGLGVPMVYDVHHHRCLGDGLSVEKVTERAVALWHSIGREPYFHISSPKYGWKSGTPRPHADYIDPGDFPPCWMNLTATVDVEAKAKELAVKRLSHDLGIRDTFLFQDRC